MTMTTNKRTRSSGSSRSSSKKISRSQSVDHSIRMMNEGVTMFVQGRDRRAIDILSKALTTIRRTIGIKLQAVASNAATADPSDMALSQKRLLSGLTLKESEKRRMIPDFHSTIPINKKIKHSRVSSSSTSSYFLFTKALIASPGMDEEEGVSPEEAELTVSIYSACIVYNMALLFDTQSRARTGDTISQACKTFFINKAAMLYRSAIRLLKNAWTTSGTALLIRLAATNNLAILQIDHASLVTGRNLSEENNEMFEMIGMADQVHPTLFNKQDIDGFLLNRYLLSDDAPGLAAAA